MPCALQCPVLRLMATDRSSGTGAVCLGSEPLSQQDRKPPRRLATPASIAAKPLLPCDRREDEANTGSPSGEGRLSEDLGIVQRAGSAAATAPRSCVVAISVPILRPMSRPTMVENR